MNGVQLLLSFKLMDLLIAYFRVMLGMDISDKTFFLKFCEPSVGWRSCLSKPFCPLQLFIISVF